MLINLNEIKNGSLNKNKTLALVGLGITMSSMMLSSSPTHNAIKANADTVQQKKTQEGLSAQVKQQIKEQYNFDAVSAKTINGNLVLTAQDGTQLTISQPNVQNSVQDVTAQTGNDSPDKYTNPDDNAENNAQQGNGQTNQQGDTNKNVDLNLPSDLSSVRQKIVELAKSQLGVPYVWGGTDWGKGMDCSGFVQQVYKQIGVNLPRTSQEQSSQLKVIPLSQAKPGDLVFWGGQGTAYHIAIYVGNNQIIEEPNPSQPCHLVHLYGNYQIGTLEGVNK